MINSREKELKAIAEIFSNICRADNRCVKLIYNDLEETKAIELLRYPYHIESCPVQNLTIRRCSECKKEHWYQFLDDPDSKVVFNSWYDLWEEWEEHCKKLNI